MLPRIALALLIACLALPAMAMPLCRPAPPSHAMTMAMAGMDHGMHGRDHGDPRRDDADDAGSAMHGCIGCIARPTPLTVARPPMAPVAIAHPQPAARMDGMAPPPSTPPPRA